MRQSAATQRSHAGAGRWTRRAEFLRAGVQPALGVWTVLILVGGASVSTAYALGDVAVSVTDEGKLKLTGDAEANAVDIVAGVDPGFVVVSGLNGTTINGSTEPAALGGVKRLSADLAEGDDTLEVRGVEFGGKVVVELGTGTNDLVLDGTRAGKKAKLESGDGEDSITVQGDARFDAKLIVKSGGGPDRITITGARCGNDLEISTKGGADTVKVLSTRMGSGAKFEVATEGGNDTMLLVDVDFEADVDVRLGDNDDDLSVEDCDFDEKVEIDGGDGHDEVDNQGGNAFDLGEVIRVRGFEDID